MPDRGQQPAATFPLADIAGFTALTERTATKEAAKLVADFSDTVTAELPRKAPARSRRSATL